MKALMMVLTLSMASFVYAEGTAAAPAAEAKLNKKQAKAECLKEKPKP